jgi:hypothetical protein
MSDNHPCILLITTEPNNASPLNADAAELWDKPDGKLALLHFPTPFLTL